ncbi:MAG: FAD-dependent oxidoreductase, partial [Bacteroidota bacterium]
MERRYDFLVLGTGIAGLTYALKVAHKGKVGLITKTTLEETNTKYAQGGIASVMYPPDDYEKHIRDTMIAGDGMCNREVVEMVISEAPSQIKQLIEWGIEFDKKENGKYDLGREGGHSEYRVLHHKDNTGEEIEQKLIQRILEHDNIDVLENHFAVDVITQHHLGKTVRRYHEDIECYGAYVMDLKTSVV